MPHTMHATGTQASHHRRITTCPEGLIGQSQNPGSNQYSDAQLSNVGLCLDLQGFTESLRFQIMVSGLVAQNGVWCEITVSYNTGGTAKCGHFWDYLISEVSLSRVCPVLLI